MAKVKPFRGTVYNSKSAGGDCSNVSSPPYDIISPALQDTLYGLSEHNVVRLILGKVSPGDGPLDNRYTRAKKCLDEWTGKGVLARDKEESFYAYVQEYEIEGEKKRRIGFIGLMEIEDPKDRKIFPHENTLSAPKEDRMELMKQVNGNLSPIFGLFSDKGKKVTKILEDTASSRPPDIEARKEDGTHKLWRITDKDATARIASLMGDSGIFIADGHHRYEVARKYRDMLRGTPGYDGSADHIMMYFTDMDSAGNLTVLPTHRAVREMPVSEDEAVKRLGELFILEESAGREAMIGRMRAKASRPNVFGFFGGRRFFVIEPKNSGKIAGLIKEKKSREWKELDVSVLHYIVFKKLLGITGAEGTITYIKTPEEAEKVVREGTHKAAFFLNSTRMDQLKAVAENGDMMPQKSTYFYPKLLTGLVMNIFEQG